jgi:hypothetical protein
MGLTVLTATPGVLTLTTRRLRFQPQAEPSSHDIPLSSIISCTEGRKRGLVVTFRDTAGQPWALTFGDRMGMPDLALWVSSVDQARTRPEAHAMSVTILDRTLVPGTAVGEERVYGADGSHGSQAHVASGATLEAVVGDLIGHHGPPNTQLADRVGWRWEMTSDRGDSVAFVEVARWSDGFVSPGLDPSRVPPGTLTIVTSGTFFAPTPRAEPEWASPLPTRANKGLWGWLRPK